MAKRTLYDVLGVSNAASDDDIKKAYKALARKFHPDLNQGNPQAEMAFKAVGQAYEVLGDVGKRAQYDAALSKDRNTPPRGTPVVNGRRESVLLAVFAVSLVLAVVFFVLDTPKGIYFLVVAVGLELKTSIAALRADMSKSAR